MVGFWIDPVDTLDATVISQHQQPMSIHLSWTKVLDLVAFLPPATKVCHLLSTISENVKHPLDQKCSKNPSCCSSSSPAILITKDPTRQKHIIYININIKSIAFSFRAVWGSMSFRRSILSCLTDPGSFPRVKTKLFGILSPVRSSTTVGFLFSAVPGFPIACDLLALFYK